MDKLLKLLAFVVLVGCGGTPDQIVTGRIASGYPTRVSGVRAVRAGQVIGVAPVAADGTFRLAFQPGSGTALQIVTSGKDQLVFPRQGATIRTTFSVRAGGVPFDLGTVRYVQNASTMNFAFHNGTSSATDCEDGKDSSGATCVDDGDDDTGTCDSETETDDDAQADDDVDDDLKDEGDAVADHNFPKDGCADDDADESDGSGSGSGHDD